MLTGRIATVSAVGDHCDSRLSDGWARVSLRVTWVWSLITTSHCASQTP